MGVLLQGFYKLPPNKCGSIACWRQAGGCMVVGPPCGASQRVQSRGLQRGVDCAVDGSWTGEEKL